MRKLALGSETSFKFDPILYVIVEDPNNPVWLTYACLHRIVTQHLPPGYTGHLFASALPIKSCVIVAKQEISQKLIGTL